MTTEEKPPPLEALREYVATAERCRAAVPDEMSLPAAALRGCEEAAREMLALATEALAAVERERDEARAKSNSWYMKCRELERAAEESARHLAAWNWCDHCRQLVDADDVHDGSEVKCLGCERVYVCTAFDGGEWRLFEAKELDEDSAADADADEWRAQAEADRALSAELETERDGYRASLADLTAAITAFFKGPANDDAANRLHRARKEARQRLESKSCVPLDGDGAAPPSERPTLPSDGDLARWYGGQRRDSSDTDHLTDLRAVALGAIELFAAGSDLESLRADRALLARYGAVLALPYLPAHAEAYCEALNAVGTELGERALALAAQGCGR